MITCLWPSIIWNLKHSIAARVFWPSIKLIAPTLPYFVNDYLSYTTLTYSSCSSKLHRICLIIFHTFYQEGPHVQSSQRKRYEVINFGREVHFVLKPLQVNAQNLAREKVNKFAEKWVVITKWLYFWVSVTYKKTPLNFFFHNLHRTSLTPATSGVPTLIFTKVQHCVRFIGSNYKICSQLTSGRCITLQSLMPFLNLKQWQVSTFKQKKSKDKRNTFLLRHQRK